ncbi:hypothetical protein [Agarilytica rhodophyticola]|uniref:hypothetical protein n=1 Tax=Agarilytica rhodophyticola TaxID=1737490 RepID=UPI000CD935EA|nr:hypothetical protein [Agarilytica rhodophyticola]
MTFLDFFSNKKVQPEPIEEKYNIIDIELSQQEADTFVNSGGDYCPCCGSTDIVGDGPEMYEGRHEHIFQCNSCEANWVCGYKICSVSNITKTEKV